MNKLLLFLATGLACVATDSQAISVGPGGAGPFTFDTLPAVGDFSSRGLGGSSGGINSVAAMDAAVETLSNTVFISSLVSSPGNPPDALAGPAQWASDGHYLQTRPTGVAASAIMATLVNHSGSAKSALILDYDLTVVAPMAEEIYGHLVYYSMTGKANSWVQIPSISNEASDNTEGSYHKNATLDLSATPWANGATMYLLWIDDNGSGTPDGAMEIDNMVFSFPDQPPVISQQPANITVTEGTVGTLTVLAGGTPPLSYQWYQGTAPGGTAVPGANSAVFSVTNTAGSGVNWTWPSDAGNYYVVVTGTVGSPVTSAGAHVTVTRDTTAPKFLYALADETDLTLIKVFLSEPLDPNNSTPGVVQDTFTWNIDSTALGAESPASIDYTNGATVILLHLDAPRDTTSAYQVVNVVDLFDRASSPNKLAANTTIVVNCFEQEIVAMDAVWRYLDNDTDPGNSWLAPGFNDTSWLSGPGPFDGKLSGAGMPPYQGDANNCRPQTYYNLGSVGTCIQLISPVTGIDAPSFYFRTHFYYPGPPTQAILNLNGKFDDSAVVYLNGEELERVGDFPPPPAPIPRGVFGTSLGGRIVNDTDPQDTAQFIFPASLAQGDNLLAVMLLQGYSTSSDVTMGLRVVAWSQSELIIPPTLAFTYIDGTLQLTWSSGVLQTNSFLGQESGWADLAGAASPFTLNNVPGATPKRLFYRLRP